MKSIGFVSVVVVVLALTGYLYSSQENAESGAQKLPAVESEKPLPASTLEQADEQPVQRVGIAKEPSDITSKPQTSNKKPGKKNYDDNWCDAKRELNESDYNFARNEYNDWLVTIGKARAGSPRTSPLAERVFLNSNLIESYESLPLEQLQDLAFKGDKWAMVTFVQNTSANVEAKNQIAKKLMVNGAFYFALEHLVLNSMLEALTSARKKQSSETIKGYVTDALAYAYWGLQYYDIGGIHSFNSAAFSEHIRKHISIDAILAESVDEVNEKLAKLNHWVNEQRIAQGIEMPTPPKSVTKFFELEIAASEDVAPKELDQLRGLGITNSNRIASTPCVKLILAGMREK